MTAKRKEEVVGEEEEKVKMINLRKEIWKKVEEEGEEDTREGAEVEAEEEGKVKI